MSVRLRISKIDEAIRIFRAMRADLTPIVSEGLRFLAEFGLERAQYYSPVRTGYMRQNMQLFQQGELMYVVFSEAYYSYWVEFGHLSLSGYFVPGQFFFTHALADCVNMVGEGELANYIASGINNAILSQVTT